MSKVTGLVLGFIMALIILVMGISVINHVDSEVTPGSYAENISQASISNVTIGFGEVATFAPLMGVVVAFVLIISFLMAMAVFKGGI